MSAWFWRLFDSEHRVVTLMAILAVLTCIRVYQLVCGYDDELFDRNPYQGHPHQPLWPDGQPERDPLAHRRMRSVMDITERRS